MRAKAVGVVIQVQMRAKAVGVVIQVQMRAKAVVVVIQVQMRAKAVVTVGPQTRTPMTPQCELPYQMVQIMFRHTVP